MVVTGERILVYQIIDIRVCLCIVERYPIVHNGCSWGRDLKPKNSKASILNYRYYAMSLCC